MTIKHLYPNARPSLDLKFAKDKVLDPRITYSRASSGTYFDSTGTPQNAATNQARFDHDPTTGESLGLLVEEARTNSYQNSEDFSSCTLINVTVNSVNNLAPNGTATASLFLETVADGDHRISLPSGVTSLANTDYTTSVFIKQAGTDTTIFLFFAGLSGGGATFDLSTGEVIGDDQGTIESLPNGWWRISITRNTTTSASRRPRLTFSSGPGDTSQGFYIWGWQVEQGSFLTSYIPTIPTFTSRSTTATYYDANGVIQTAGINVARDNAYFPDSNGVMKPAGLLLEAAGTNLHTYSEQFDNAAWAKYGVTVTANAVVSPDGTTTADKFASTAGAALLALQQPVTRTASTVYTVSIFAKSAEISSLTLQIGNTTEGTILVTADLSAGTATNSGVVVKLPNGWYRIYRTFTQNTGTVGDFYVRLPDSTVAGSGIYIWGAQLETGSYPTSYIPTSGSTVTRAADVSSSSTVTRSADVARITGSNFSSWYNQSEGTVFCNTTFLGLPDNFSLNTLFSLQTNASTPRTHLLAYGINSRMRLLADNTGDIYPSNTFASTVTRKSGVGYKANDLVLTVNGSILGNDATYSPTSSINQIVFDTGTGAVASSKHISRLTYYPVRLPDATLQTLTS